MRIKSYTSLVSRQTWRVVFLKFERDQFSEGFLYPQRGNIV